LDALNVAVLVMRRMVDEITHHLKPSACLD
jgi:hypothetical protein